MALFAALTQLFPPRRRRDFLSSSGWTSRQDGPSDLSSGRDVWSESAARPIYPEDRAARSGRARSVLEDSIHAARRVRIRGNKSVIESALSPPRPLMETRPHVRASSYTGVTRSFSVPFFLRPPPLCRHPRRRPRFNLNPIAGSATISIPTVTKPAIYGGDLLPYL